MADRPVFPTGPAWGSCAIRPRSPASAPAEIARAAKILDPDIALLRLLAP